MDKIPTCEWIQDSEEQGDKRPTVDDNGEASIANPSETEAMQYDQRELYLMKKQAELAERELALARRDMQ